MDVIYKQACYSGQELVNQKNYCFIVLKSSYGSVGIHLQPF
ncbi:hypothetical protein C427_5494 [Paraglaciecola psychrophila 170]|uniref:Uncharacterized protein n=1 Tax=Paraglaciecola psychrophila 170 TaxID=1129794 RepID=K7ACP4_9ALTE|nr:hypothetical protein C427_5494 [Paraglaciecola psychrophila 170]GAC40047.1 hypothetical protein GPSY_4444 [Paraglaciecola psychrophila 170]